MRLALAVSSLALLASPALAQNPRQIKISDDSTNSLPAVAVGENGVAAMLRQDGLTTQILLHRSLDKGITWDEGTPVMTMSGQKTVRPDSLWIVQGKAYVALVNSFFGQSLVDTLAVTVVDLATATPSVLVFEQNIMDGGGVVGTSEVRDFRFEVTENAAGTGANMVLAILVDPGNAGGPDELYVASSTDGTTGPGFDQAPIFVPSWTAGAFDVDQIDLAGEGDRFYVTWADNSASTGPTVMDDTYVELSVDGGLSWGPTVPVSTTGTVNQQDDVSIAVRDDQVLITWPEERPTNIDRLAARMFDADLVPQTGVTTPQTANRDVDDTLAAITGDGTAVILFNDDRVALNRDTFFIARSTDGGANWTETVLSQNTFPDSVMFPRLVAGDDGVVVASWLQDPIPERGYAAYSCDHGGSWTVLEAVTTPDDVDFVEVAYDPQNKNVMLGIKADTPLFVTAGLPYSGGFNVCSTSEATLRNGGTNPVSLSSSTAVLGGTLQATVDLTTTGHDSAFLLAFDTPISGVTLSTGQTLLCIDQGSGELLSGAGLFAAGPTATFSIPVPNDPCLYEFEFCLFAVHVFGIDPFSLSNVYDMRIGPM